MPLEEQHEGLVLRSIDFKDKQKIITLYTPKRGLIYVIVKGITRKKTHLLTLTTPFTIAEYHFSIGRSDLYRFIDGTLLFTNYSLRSSLPHLQAAALLTKALLTSQLPCKSSPRLYQLTRTYLKHLPTFQTPETLVASYYVKLLMHEGLFNQTHLGPSFTQAEWQKLLPLLTTKTIPHLKTLTITPSLYEKMTTYFQKKIRS